jgi:hypothetical protein
MPGAAGVMKYPASAAWIRWAEQWEVPMETNVRIVGKTNLAIVILLTVTYLFCVIAFGVGGTVISILTILGIHDAVSDAPYWADLIVALFVGALGVGVIKVMWRYPFVFLREYSFDGEVLMDPWIDPDEKFLIFMRDDWVNLRPGQGSSDLFITYIQEDGSWGEPLNLGSAVNTKHFDRSPSLSPDGNHLIFIRAVGEMFVTSDAHFYQISAEVFDNLQPD